MYTEGATNSLSTLLLLLRHVLPTGALHRAEDEGPAIAAVELSDIIVGEKRTRRRKRIIPNVLGITSSCFPASACTRPLEWGEA